MPTRILRDGILSSERIALLSWPEEVFYRRLMSVVDDHGRYYAQAKLLRSACYPLQIDKVSDPDIGKWLSACETAGLVRVYATSDAKRYLEMLDFGQRVQSKSKFPDPPMETAETCDPPQFTGIHGEPPCNTVNNRLVGVVVGDVVEGGISTAATRRAPPPVDLLADVDPQVAKDFLAIRKAKRAPLTQTALDGIVKEAAKAGITLTDALRVCCEKGWQSFKAEWYFNANGGGSGVPREAPRRRKELA